MSYVNTPQPGRYTTRLLDDLRADPVLRSLAAIAIVLLVSSAIGLTQVLRQRSAAAQATPLPIIILATAAPQARPAPTATPAPQPQVVTLADGTVVAFNGREWTILRDAGQVDQPVAADVAPTAAPEVYQATYSGPQDAPETAPAPEAAPRGTHERENAPNDLGPGGSGKLPVIDFGPIEAPQGAGDDASRWCMAAGAMCRP